MDDIEQRILTARASKDKLGPSRTSIDDQRSFLIQLSQTFQTICQAAVRGDYDNDFFHSDELREKRLFQSDELSEKRLCAILMDKHFGFADNLLKKGCQWTIGERSFDAVGFTFDTKRRTREEAIADACRLLKRSRGREVKTPLLYAQKQSYVDSNANKFGYSCLVFRIHSWWENFSVNIAAHGIHLLGCILRIPGKLRTDFLTLCSST